MGYYNAHDGMSVKDFVKNWQDGHKAYDDSMPVMMDVEDLWRYRDYNRTPDSAQLGFSWPYKSEEGELERMNKAHLRGQDKWNTMIQSMKKYGWSKNEPLHLNVGRDGKAKVGEGNHRLAIWRELGQSQAPVVVHFTTEVYQTVPSMSRPPRVVENFRFKSWLENFDYLSIGHNFDGSYDSWVLPKNSKDILTSSETTNEDPEYFHDKYHNFDYKGRIDHDKKMISVITGGGDEEKLNYVVSILKMDYPNYSIWLFGYGSPKKL